MGFSSILRFYHHDHDRSKSVLGRVRNSSMLVLRLCCEMVAVILHVETSQVHVAIITEWCRWVAVAPPAVCLQSNMAACTVW